MIHPENTEQLTKLQTLRRIIELAQGKFYDLPFLWDEIHNLLESQREEALEGLRYLWERRAELPDVVIVEGLGDELFVELEDYWLNH